LMGLDAGQQFGAAPHIEDALAQFPNVHRALQRLDGEPCCLESCTSRFAITKSATENGTSS
jgi:hypothetical protein